MQNNVKWREGCKLADVARQYFSYVFDCFKYVLKVQVWASFNSNPLNFIEREGNK